VAKPLVVEPEPAPPGPTPPGQVRVVKVTGPEDGQLLNRGYSYWSQVWLNGAHALLFCGHADGHPRFFHVDLHNWTVERLGSLVPYGGTGEGWYFDNLGRVYLTDGPRLRRYDLATGQDEVIFEDPTPNCRLWQAHSSDDGAAHSATLQAIVDDGPYLNLGTVVYRNGARQYFPALGALDESQIDTSGRWLLIKEDDQNRVIDLETGRDARISDADGAVGHSDCGAWYVVGEDDQHGACVLWDLSALTRRELFKTWGMGHVSVRAGRCLLSGSQALSLVPLGGGEPQHLVDHDMVSDGTYDTQVFANLDHTGRVAAYMSNAAGRMDLYVAVVR